MSLGQLIKSKREQIGLSRKGLADQLGVNVNSIAKYEKAGEIGGQYPPYPVLARIVDALGLNPTAVFAEGLEDEKSKARLGARYRNQVLMLLNLYNQMSDSIAILENELMIVREGIVDLIGPVESIPEDIRERFTGDYEFALFPRLTKNDPDHEGPGRSENPTSDPEVVGATSSNQPKETGG